MYSDICHTVRIIILAVESLNIYNAWSHKDFLDSEI